MIPDTKNDVTRVMMYDTLQVVDEDNLLLENSIRYEITNGLIGHVPGLKLMRCASLCTSTQHYYSRGY